MDHEYSFLFLVARSRGKVVEEAGGKALQSNTPVYRLMIVSEGGTLRDAKDRRNRDE